MITSRNSARLGLSLVTAAAIVLGAGVSGAAASNGPGRSGDAHAEHGHPNPDAVRGHDEEGKRGKGHESHGNGHGYGHGDHSDQIDGPKPIDVVIIDEPAPNQPVIDEPTPNQPVIDEPTSSQPVQDERANDDSRVAQILPNVEPVVVNELPSTTKDVAVAVGSPSSASEAPFVSTAEVRPSALVATVKALIAEIGSGGSAAGAILRHC